MPIITSAKLFSKWKIICIFHNFLLYSCSIGNFDRNLRSDRGNEYY
jgi:hypothetical protein